MMSSGIARTLMILASLLIFFGPLSMNLYKETYELAAQVIAVLMLVLLFWTGSYKGRVGYAYGLFILLSFVFVALYLIPLSEQTWTALPGRELYADVLALLKDQEMGLTYTSLSLIPENTKRALFYLIPLIALFLVTMSLPKAEVRKLIVVFLVIVAFQAGLGVIQYASGGADVFYIGNEEHGNTASGSYRNRDHFAALMEMAIPLVLGMLMAAVFGQKGRKRKVSQGVLSGSLTLGILFIIIFMAAFFSASRAGVGLAVFGVLISAFVFAQSFGKIKSFGFVVIGSFVGIIAAFQVGIVPILNRFAKDPMEDERWRIFENTKRAISDMFPFGSGPGTFPEVYRGYQPIEQQRFVNHAHNDYLEIMSDMGVFGMIIIGSFFLLYLVRWVVLMRSNDTSSFRNAQLGAGLGMLLLLLHSYVDFNLHQAANALVFVFLAGVFFRFSKE